MFTFFCLVPGIFALYGGGDVTSSSGSSSSSSTGSGGGGGGTGGGIIIGQKYQCSDGLDNDGNGLVDYPSDPGCFGIYDNTEDTSILVGGLVKIDEPKTEDVQPVEEAPAVTGEAVAKEPLQIDIVKLLPIVLGLVIVVALLIFLYKKKKDKEEIEALEKKAEVVKKIKGKKD